jgi:hypothetical protein
MSASDKSKLDGVQAGAQVNRTYTARTGYPTSNTTPDFGEITAVSQVSQDETGQITLTHRTIRIPSKTASTSAPGLMSASDKTKLNNIEAGAEVNQNAFGVVDIESGSATAIYATSKQDGITFKAGSNVSLLASGKNVTISATDTKYNAATTSAAGLMSAVDKARLDSIVRPFVASSRASVTVQPKLSAEIIYDIPVETVGTGYTSAVLEGIVLPNGLCIGNIQRTVSDGSITAIKVTVTNASGDTRTVPQHSRAMVLLVKSSY